MAGTRLHSSDSIHLSLRLSAVINLYITEISILVLNGKHLTVEDPQCKEEGCYYMYSSG